LQFETAIGDYMGNIEEVQELESDQESGPEQIDAVEDDNSLAYLIPSPEDVARDAFEHASESDRARMLKRDKQTVTFDGEEIELPQDPANFKEFFEEFADKFRKAKPDDRGTRLEQENREMREKLARVEGRLDEAGKNREPVKVDDHELSDARHDYEAANERLAKVHTDGGDADEFKAAMRERDVSFASILNIQIRNKYSAALQEIAEMRDTVSSLKPMILAQNQMREAKVLARHWDMEDQVPQIAQLLPEALRMLQEKGVTDEELQNPIRRMEALYFLKGVVKNGKTVDPVVRARTQSAALRAPQRAPQPGRNESPARKPGNTSNRQYMSDEETWARLINS
jgi:hypothetical protein